MQIQKKLLYIGSSRYSFEADDGKKLAATKIHTVDATEKALGDDVTGLYVGELKADYMLFDKIKKLEPLTYYTFALELTMQGKKAVITVADVDVNANK